MANNKLRDKKYSDFFQCYIDGELSDQCKILIDLQNAGRVETVIEKVEKKEGKNAANEMRATLNSQQFTESQREDLREHWSDKKIQFMEQSGELPEEFFRDDIETQDRAKILGAIMNPDPQHQSSKYAQYQTLLSSAKNNPADMETLRNAVRTWPMDKREQFNREVISRASHEEVVAYMETIDRQMRSSQDARFVEELRDEKKQIFEDLAPAEKARLFKEAALKSVRDGYDAPLAEHKAMLQNATPENMSAYNAAFQNIIFETSPRNPQEMAEMASIYSLMPQEARTAYLKTSQQDQKAIDHILAIRDAAATRGDRATVQVIEQDFKGAGMISKYTQPSQRAVRQAQPKATQLGGQPESRARGGSSAQLNQEALKQAREQSGGAGEVSVSPAVREITTLPPAQGATKYIESTPQVAQEMIQKHPEYIIAMRDEASADAQARIINDIKSSKPARRFGSVKTSEERKKLFIGGDGIEALSQQEQKIILEAVADNPLQLTHLRSAIQQLSQEQQKQFYENVLAEASEQARQQYAQHVRQEKIVATQENRAVDVERLTREEQVIISKRPLMRQQAPQVDAIKPNGKKTAAAILTPPQPSATVTVAPRGKTVEGAETVAPGGTAAPAEGVPISAIETFKEKLRKARSKEELEALLKELTAYRDGLRLLRQGQLEQGLAETSYEIKNTDRLISEAELLIEEIKKQLAKFSS